MRDAKHRPCRIPPPARWCSLPAGHKGRCALNKVTPPRDPFGDNDRPHTAEFMQRIEQEGRHYDDR